MNLKRRITEIIVISIFVLFVAFVACISVRHYFFMKASIKDICKAQSTYMVRGTLYSCKEMGYQ